MAPERSMALRREMPFHSVQWRGLATRYDKHAVIYRAAVVLNAVVAWTRQLAQPR